MKMNYCISMLALLAYVWQPVYLIAKERTQIGAVLGKPVYRDQLSATDKKGLHAQLHNIFTRPVFFRYYKEHKAELEPQEKEIEQFVRFYQKKHQAEIKGKKASLEKKLAEIDTALQQKAVTANQRKRLEVERDMVKMDLDGPGRRFAMFVLPHWKLQEHLYTHFGGGRLLWQQRGIEAFDAMHSWLKYHEKIGLFKITDEKLREAFYYYWTKMDHGSFLITDEKRIEKEFLKPEWQTSN